MVPRVATPGNHEYSGTSSRRTGDRASRCRRTARRHGLRLRRAQGHRVLHRLSGRPVHLAELELGAVPSANCVRSSSSIQAPVAGEPAGEQPDKWTVVTFHHPMFSNEPARNNPAQRAAWLPIFERYGVDLVLQGHDHSYARGNLVAGSRRRRGNGTMYVVSVSGPKMYGADNSNWVENGAVSNARCWTNTQLYRSSRSTATSSPTRRRRPRAALRRSVHDRQAGRPGRRSSPRTSANVEPEGVGRRRAGTLSLSLAARAGAWARSPPASAGLRGRRRGHDHLLGGRRDADASSTRRRPTRASSSTARSRSRSRSRPRSSGAFGADRRHAAGAAQLRRADRQRCGSTIAQAGHRRQRGAAHGRLQEGADADALDDAAVGRYARLHDATHGVPSGSARSRARTRSPRLRPPLRFPASRRSARSPRPSFAAADRLAARLRDHARGGGPRDLRGHAAEWMYNPIGSVHGGVAATLLDSSLGCAIHTTLDAGVAYTNSDLQVRYAGRMSADSGRVLAESHVVHRGRSSRPPRGGCTPRTAGSCSGTPRPAA